MQSTSSDKPAHAELPPERSYNYDLRYYDLGIGGFHEASFESIARGLDEAIGGVRAPRVLDFGCGGGFYGKFLRERAETLHGVDGSDALESSPRRAFYDGFTRADLGAAWHPERPYDVVFSIEVIEHVRDYQTFLRNAHDALVPGGRLYLTTTTYFWTIFVLLVMYHRQVSASALAEFLRGWAGSEEARSKFVMRFWEFFTGHYHGFTKRQLVQRVKEAGFEVIRADYLHVQPVFPVRYLDHPYHGPCAGLVRLTVPPAKLLGRALNWGCEHLDLYAPNVVLVAQKRER